MYNKNMPKLLSTRGGGVSKYKNHSLFHLFFLGSLNRITFQEVYTKTFKCEYQLQLYPFDTQVLSIL